MLRELRELKELQEEMIILNKKDYQELLELAELGRKFKDNRGKAKGCHEHIYKEIRELKRKGVRPKDIIGKEIQGKEITAGIYYRAIK